MASKRNLRIVAFAVIAAAVIAGLAARLAYSDPRAQIERIPRVDAMDLRAGDKIGGFAVESVVGTDAAAAVQLRGQACDGPIFALPILLTAVTMTEVVDTAYLRRGYRSLDVYDAKVKDRFSHFERLLARIALATRPGGDDFFVSFYTPADCRIDDADYVAAAQALLRPGKAAE